MLFWYTQILVIYFLLQNTITNCMCYDLPKHRNQNKHIGKIKQHRKYSNLESWLLQDIQRPPASYQISLQETITNTIQNHYHAFVRPFKTLKSFKTNIRKTTQILKLENHNNWYIFEHIPKAPASGLLEQMLTPLYNK